MLSKYPDNHSHELHKFNLRKLQTICAFGESPGFSEGSDGCSPKADHPRRTVGHVPPENFNFLTPQKGDCSILRDSGGFFLFHVFETVSAF